VAGMECVLKMDDGNYYIRTVDSISVKNVIFTTAGLPQPATGTVAEVRTITDEIDCRNRRVRVIGGASMRSADAASRLPGGADADYLNTSIGYYSGSLQTPTNHAPVLAVGYLGSGVTWSEAGWAAQSTTAANFRGCAIYSGEESAATDGWRIFCDENGALRITYAHADITAAKGQLAYFSLDIVLSPKLE